MHDAPARIRAGIGVAVAVLLAGLSVLALQYGQGAYDRGYEISAVFPTSSQGLFTDGGSLVKLRGLNVGSVSGIELQRDGRARVTLFIDEDVRLPETTMASIEPLSVFGPKFVRLEPGDHDGDGPWLEDGGEITRTQTQRELTDILASTTALFEAIDPLDVVATIDAVAEGTAGMGDEIGRTIDSSSVLAGIAARHADDLSRFLTDVALLSETFADHADDLLVLNDDLGVLAGLVNEDPDRIDRLLSTTADISSTFADLLRDNDENLGAAIGSVSAFIAGIDAESDRLPDFLDLIGTFFGRFSDIIRFEGPDGTKMAGLRGFISVDLCLVYGICPGGAAAVGGTGEARALQAFQDAQPLAPDDRAMVDALVGTEVGGR